MEENIKALDFARTSIYRPGLINRGELMRTVETIAHYLVPSVRGLLHQLLCADACRS